MPGSISVVDVGALLCKEPVGRSPELAHGTVEAALLLSGVQLQVDSAAASCLSWTARVAGGGGPGGMLRASGALKLCPAN